MQIALSSVSGKDTNSATRFITELSGTQRFIFEYLAEEVLAQHTPQLERVLQDELQVQPSPATQRLVQQLLGQVKPG